MFLLPGRLRRGASVLFELVRAASAAGVVYDCGLHCSLCVFDAVRVVRCFFQVLSVAYVSHSFGPECGFLCLCN